MLGVALASLFLAAAPAPAAAETAEVEVSSGSRFRLPKGWSVERSSAGVMISPPEGDLELSFLELPRRMAYQESAAEAWALAQPGFDLKPLQEASPPPRDGWDEIHQIVYDLPARESRSVVALVRVHGERAYVNLMDGAGAAYSRRGAQLGEALESWKPAGLVEPSLAGRKPRPWGEAESRELEAFLLAAMERLRVPGAAVAVVQAGRVAYARGFGLRRLGAPEPVTPRTLFMIGSTTKPLTTFLMAKLVEQGKLAWSTPVSRLLKDFALGDPETTRRLELQHTACACTGMPRRDMEFIFKFAGVGPEERLAQMRDMKPTTGFGETFQYSNLLVAAGGYAAARANVPEGGLEQAYQRSMRELVFGPLGMNDSVLTAEEALAREAARPHALDFHGKAREIPLRLEGAVYSVAPAGAAWSSVEDLSRYLLVELGRGVRPDGARVLGEEELLRRRAKGMKITDKAYYGLGLTLEEEQGLQLIGHGGNTLGFSADLYFLPAEGLGVAVVTNLAGANRFLAAARAKLLELLFDAAPRADRLVGYAASRTEDGVKKLHEKVSLEASRTAWIAELLGDYENPDLGSARISASMGGFEIDFGDWKSRLGVEVQANGDRLLALVDPPWSGGLGLLAGKDGRELILDDGQVKYAFRRR